MRGAPRGQGLRYMEGRQPDQGTDDPKR